MLLITIKLPYDDIIQREGEREGAGGEYKGRGIEKEGEWREDRDWGKQ